MDTWKWNNYADTKYISIPYWEQMGVAHAFTTRMGGYSTGEFASLNMGLHVGDEPEKVIKNRAKVLQGLDSSLDNMVCCEQVHGVKVAIINKENRGNGAYNHASALKGVDAMVTNIPHLFLTTFYADCYPLFLFDPKKRVIGIAHSGWKGTMGKIGLKTLEVMQEHYGTNPEDLQVFIGPGIGQCCFEISAELAIQVNREFKDYSQVLFENKKGFWWDLQNTNRQVLLKNGIREEAIILSNLCTACNVGEFFSYRQEKGNTGRMAAVIGLRF